MKKLEACTIYGIDFSGLKDKQIQDLLNAFLAPYQRTTSKVSKAMLGQMTKGFWNLNKETGTYILFTPNETVAGEKFFKDLESQYNWLIKILYHSHLPEGSPEKGAEFVEKWFESLNRPTKLIVEQKESEKPAF